MRTLLSLAAALVALGILVDVQAQFPPFSPTKEVAPKGVNRPSCRTGYCAGSDVPTNLQVLNLDTYPGAMQHFVMSLGLLDNEGCSYCHVADRASDEKPQKVMARNMLMMVRELNARFPDGEQRVTCYTCHRGSKTPATAP